jgi:hypothetical protein
MALERTRLNIRRFNSIKNKPDIMAYNAFGLICTILINRIIISLQRPLTLCFSSIIM